MVVIVPPFSSMVLEVRVRAPLSSTAPVMFAWSLVVAPVFTLNGAAVAPLVPVKVKTFVPVPRVIVIEVTAELGIVIVLVPPPLTLPAPAPVGGLKCRPPVSVKV